VANVVEHLDGKRVSRYAAKSCEYYVVHLKPVLLSREGNVSVVGDHKNSNHEEHRYKDCLDYLE
jgi:hypothetical protein